MDLNCTDVQECLPPPDPLNCTDVIGCDLTLNSLIVQNLTSMDYQQVLQVDNLFVNETLTCSSSLQIGEGCPIISTIMPDIDKDFVIIGGHSVIVTGGLNKATI
jgi:hypothetical protein